MKKLLKFLLLVPAIAMLWSCSNTEKPEDTPSPTKVRSIYFEGKVKLGDVEYDVSIIEEYYAVVEVDPNKTSLVTNVSLDPIDADTSIIGYDLNYDDGVWDRIFYCNGGCFEASRSEAGWIWEEDIKQETVISTVKDLTHALEQVRKKGNITAIEKWSSEQKELVFTYPEEDTQ